MRICLSFVLLLAALASGLAADDVYLANGRSFKGVIAETSDSQVHIRIAGGVVSLPASQVLRVEKAESSLGEYLARKQALELSLEAGAADWLALARWARTRGLEHGVREAALEAAEINPQLEGLAPLLRSLGYVYDEQVDRFVSYDDFMVRRGFVEANGSWIPRGEYEAERQRRDAELALRRAAQQEAARVAREERLAALAEISLLRDARPAAGYSAPPLLMLPGYWFPPVFVPPLSPGTPGTPREPDPGEPPPHRPRHREPDRPRHGHGGIRIPGSLIPFDGGR